MKNRDMPAKPLTGNAYDDFADFDSSRKDSSYNPQCQGLTKLEYAAIQIMAGMEGTYRYNLSDVAVKRANELFDELEKQRGDE